MAIVVVERSLFLRFDCNNKILNVILEAYSNFIVCSFVLDMAVVCWTDPGHKLKQPAKLHTTRIPRTGVFHKH